MKTTQRDYTILTAHAKNCGMIPYVNRFGKTEEGMYTLDSYNAPVDLSACAEDEKSILRTAVKQLSERVDNAYHDSIERNLTD